MVTHKKTRPQRKLRAQRVFTCLQVRGFLIFSVMKKLCDCVISGVTQSHRLFFGVTCCTTVTKQSHENLF